MSCAGMASRHPLFLLLDRELADLVVESNYLLCARSALAENLSQVHPQLDQIVYIAMASTIEKLYGGMEKCLQRIASNIDEFIPRGESWHRDLIDQMGLATDDRPPVISQGTAEGLHRLRAFRHRERNLYGGVLDRQRVLDMAGEALAVLRDFCDEVRIFEKAMGAM